MSKYAKPYMNHDKFRSIKIILHGYCEYNVIKLEIKSAPQKNLSNQ